ncbi:DNA mismatch repair endonuclease MutL [Dictyobacter aurantiacus]|uniref:DNA mismatch repair protein MutL n=1 Tax=Dictyobacter aurantiacus TaxID=1936993 RepID=A0A401ZHD6_9CHLR|nr:DNA mismatch repair endonuclease MutL [Dictyobacter aurantiacus]GCE06279.1 DNA mismatch repair protein MutL [Dictyobacter aurantiacus]
MSQLFEFMIQRPEFVRTALHELPPAVAERIAAGEVIERPVSVVKELVENALDAGAQDIRVEVRGGGLRLIRVSDDGYGIPAEDLAAVCERHTTSKLTAFEDLERLRTLGFRGEALASIATIAEVTILSRAWETERDEEGEQPAYWYTWRGGQVQGHGRRARPHGTTVTVTDLFYNVPARLSYTRAARTENGHIVQLIRRYAVGYPSVRFHLALDEHTAIQTSGSGNLATTLTELYHISLEEMLQEIDVSDEEHYRLRGYLGNRVLAQGSRQYITLFINGRWVQSRVLQDALEEGYRSLLPKGKHPLLVLALEVPPQEVDVNIHPAKTEVHLLQEAKIKEAVTQTIKGLLERSPVVPEAVQFPGPVLATQRRLPGPRRRGLHVAESAEGYRAESAEPGTAEVIVSLRPLAQLQQAVILAEAPDGSLYMVDQHRAHERIIYEHLRSTYSGVRPEEEAIHSHLLLEPVIIEMKRYEAELLEQRLPMLRGLGIECERFGGRSFLIRSVPASEGSEQLVPHLQELAELAAEDSTNWEDHLLIGLACRSALKRGRELGPGEQRTLLKNLATVSAPAVCPHGSPILLHYSRTFLIKKFDW